MTSHTNIYNTYNTGLYNTFNEHPFVGTYVHAQLEFYKRDDSWYETECFCESFQNNMFTVRTKYDKIYYVPLQQIKYQIPIKSTQIYKVGDTVNAVVHYHQIDGPWYDYCKIISVRKFANDIDYELLILSSNKTISVEQKNIKSIATLKKAKYNIGDYVGVKYIEGPQYDTYIQVKNGNIIVVKEWYDKVTYHVIHEDGVVNQYVYDEYIVPPKKPEPVKTPAQIKQEHLDFLNQEEKRLLEQLENIRLAKLRM